MPKNPQHESSVDVGELIRPDDFKSLEITITVKNTTTAGELRRQGAVHIVEFLERGMIFEAPSRFCQKSHYLVLNFETEIPKQSDKFKFNTGAKVESVETLGEGRDVVIVSLIQNDMGEWQKFQSLVGNRQSEIDAFLKAAKGG